MKRSTVPVRALVDAANLFLEHSHPGMSEQRKGVAHFINNVLLKVGHYKGFNYLKTESDIHADMYGKDGRVFFFVDEKLPDTDVIVDCYPDDFPRSRKLNQP